MVRRPRAAADAAGACQRLGAGAGRMAIDLGCGDGTDTLALLDRGWSVLAVDIEPAGLALLRARIPRQRRARPPSARLVRRRRPSHRAPDPCQVQPALLPALPVPGPVGADTPRAGPRRDLRRAAVRYPRQLGRRARHDLPGPVPRSPGSWTACRSSNCTKPNVTARPAAAPSTGTPTTYWPAASRTRASRATNLPNRRRHTWRHDSMSDRCHPETSFGPRNDFRGFDILLCHRAQW